MLRTTFGATLRNLCRPGGCRSNHRRFQLLASSLKQGDDVILNENANMSTSIHKTLVKRRSLTSATSTTSSKAAKPKAPRKPRKKITNAVKSADHSLSSCSLKDFALSTVEAPPLHTKTTRWILFSDLHVKLSSIETCEEVLDIVYEEASKRDAGIVFLGDFWHVRGALNVELLNRVLKSLEKWRCPVIMIPGNHDQVTLGGSIHSLEPLQYVFPKDQILMLSDPCVCLGALWIPYRRDHELMKAILSNGFKRDDFNAIFCHADVHGAFMNDNMKSKDGISVEMFPPGKIVYSGHFHKPHTLKKSRSSLRYLGSPYQTSLSEAGQKKYLYCLSSKVNSQNDVSERTWSEEERFEIEVGRKYFRASGFNDPILFKAQKGDRVVVQVGRNESYDESFDEFKERGIEVELRMQSRSPLMSTRETSLDDSEVNSIKEGNIDESLSQESGDNPIQVFDNFVNLSSVKSGTESAFKNSDENVNRTESKTENTFEAFYKQIVEEGRSTIERVMSSVNADTSSAASAGGITKNVIGSGKIRDLSLDYVTLKDFGPYGGNTIQYPLSNRGLVLLRGQSSDGTGADSNGAGKTTLAMSVMWALTGSMDARLIADGKAVDVAYDTASKLTNKKTRKRIAEVTLVGKINGSPFRVERKRGANKVQLNFWVDDKEQTQLSVKDTQATIDDILGVGSGLLQRCCFYGQHSHTLQSLLGLSDIKLKSEMAALVDTELWTLALQDVKSRDKLCKTRVHEISVEGRIRKEEILRAKKSLEESMKRHRSLELQRDSAVKNFEKEIGKVNATKGIKQNSIDEITKAIESKKMELREHKAKVLDPLIERSMMRTTTNENDALVKVDKAIKEINEKMFVTETSLASLNNSSHALSLKVEKLTKNINEVIESINKSVSRYMSVAERTSATDKSFTYPLADEDMEALTNLTTKVVSNTKERYEDIIRRYASTDNELRATSKSLAALESVTDCSESHNEKTQHENCPTCGQPLQAEAREYRMIETNEKIERLKTEVAELGQVRNTTKTALSELDALQKLLEQVNSLESTLIEAQDALIDEENKITIQSNEMKTLKQLAEIESSTKRTLQSEHELENENLNHDVKAAQQMNEHIVAELEKLNGQLETARKSESLHAETQLKINATISSYNDRLGDSQNDLKKQSMVLFELEGKVKEGDQEKTELLKDSLVLEQLVSILGPRGIQHYVFLDALRLLESIANSYLNVLADGGIQLSLQSNEDADKIVKSVLIRASDGKFRERALSQLSGGQWRRVSMSLDFAFAEVVRRKGTLRSNFIVMDEVLTHLDASGREAVGSVLRALVSKSSSNDSEDGHDVDDGEEWARDLLGGGSYETVLIILQDLAATELEEAFDHIDVVVKEKDSSVVKIDGLIE